VAAVVGWPLIAFVGSL